MRKVPSKTLILGFRDKSNLNPKSKDSLRDKDNPKITSRQLLLSNQLFLMM